MHSIKPIGVRIQWSTFKTMQYRVFPGGFNIPGHSRETRIPGNCFKKYRSLKQHFDIRVSVKTGEEVYLFSSYFAVILVFPNDWTIFFKVFEWWWVYHYLPQNNVIIAKPLVYVYLLLFILVPEIILIVYIWGYR